VVVDDTLVVGGRVIPGEDRRAAAAAGAIGDPAALDRLGIGWVLVEHGTPGDVPAAALAGLTRVHDGRWLALYRVPREAAGPAPAVTGGTAARVAVIATDAAVLVLILGAGVLLLRRRLPAGTFRSVAEPGAS
jgi:hypothetical protein